MRTYVIDALIPLTFTVEAESEEQAIEIATTQKRFSMTSPDGERVDIEEEDIKHVYLAEEEKE